MGHLLGVLDQSRLDEQRGVVQNEKRQSENRPYGVTDELLTKGTAQPGHPYSWTVIGSMEDLNAASLDDVRTWFKTYYGAANAVLVLAGDIDADTALKKVEQYFADIPAGPPVARFEKWIAKIPGTRRQTVSDRVPQARIYKAWNIPGYGEPDAIRMEIVRNLLASGKTSRLYKRLVYDEQIATDVTASIDESEISQTLLIKSRARPGDDLTKVEKAIDEEVTRFLAEGPTQEELQRAKAGIISAFVRGIERIGGFGGKSDILAMNETFRGQPDFYQTILKQTREATAQDLQNAARKWLTEDVYILEVHPYAKHEIGSSTVDRSKLPTRGRGAGSEVSGPAAGPTVQRFEGHLAERHATPIVDLSLWVDAGAASDQTATPGTARLAMDLLDAGTTQRTALQISDELSSLGATLTTQSFQHGLDSSSVKLSALKAALDPALDIFADVILNPSFPESDVKRLRNQMIAEIQREQSQPPMMALRVFPRILYGSKHAYGNPLTGTGTEASVAKLNRAGVQRFHDTWFTANNATLIIIGDTTLTEITPKLEKLFGRWKAGNVPAKNLAQVEQQNSSMVYLIDRPGSIQSLIFAGHVRHPKPIRTRLRLRP